MPTKTQVRRPTKKQREASGLVFETPPLLGSRGSYVNWSETLTPLMGFPGEWVKVKHTVSERAAYQCFHRLKHRKHTYPAGQWEFGFNLDGDVYARYLGA